MKRLIWAVIAIFVATTVGAQSLADVAKKEKQRRQQLGGQESRTVTDTELRRAGGPRLSSTVTADSADSEDSDNADDADLAADEEEVVDERRDEAYWRGRLAPLDERISSMETRLQGPEFTSNPVGGPDRQRLEQQIAAARAERQAVLDEARRKGAPPGWLR